jgi:hypothetical protein
MYRFETFVLTLLIAAPCWAGLGRLELNTEDAVIAPGRPALFVTALERKYTLAMGDDVEDATIEFYFDGQLIGRGVTDRNGSAAITVNLAIPAHRPSTYLARAVRKGRVVQAAGRVYYWNPRRTVLAVDVDETISHTHYSDLFIASIDRHSRPLDGASDALWKLSKHYEILYISARPRWLNEKTRKWLRANNFPPGAVANAIKFEAALHQRRYKQEMLVKWRERFPNILIGVGDKKADDKAYGANNMLTIIIDKPRFTRYGPHCLVFSNWARVTDFFEEQHARLADASRLAGLIADASDLRAAFAAPPLVGEPVSNEQEDGPDRPIKPDEVALKPDRLRDVGM